MTPPPKLPLARIPTPLERARRSAEALGIDLWIKRDDLTGSALSGNKVRKLEFLLADAQAAGADIVVTCGGEQSNHCRATAIAARRAGMDSLLVLRTADPGAPPAATGNILLDRIAGAEVQWITPQEYARRNELLEERAEDLRSAGRRPYVIPEGGSNALGCWGYACAAAELARDLADLPAAKTTVLYACGSGGTGAGLLLGRALHDLDVTITGVNVCDDADTFRAVIGGLCADFDRDYGTRCAIEPADIEIIDGYVGLGYARSRTEELAELVGLARRDGVILDPVYSGKAFYALTRELKAGRDLGERVVFLHTGGIFGLMRGGGDLPWDELLG